MNFIQKGVKGNSLTLREARKIAFYFRIVAFQILYLYYKQKAADCRNISASREAPLKVLFNEFLVQYAAAGLHTP